MAKVEEICIVRCKNKEEGGYWQRKFGVIWWREMKKECNLLMTRRLCKTRWLFISLFLSSLVRFRHTKSRHLQVNPLFGVRLPSLPVPPATLSLSARCRTLNKPRNEYSILAVAVAKWIFEMIEA